MKVGGGVVKINQASRFGNHSPSHAQIISL